MKIKLSFLLLLSLKLLGQNTLDSLVNQLKEHDYVSTQKILLNSNKPVVKNAFSYLLDYKQLGYGTFELYGEEGLSNREIIVNRYVYGDYLTHQTQPKDSLAYIQFKNAYALAKQTKDTLLLQECLFRICILQFHYQLPYKKKERLCSPNKNI